MASPSGQGPSPEERPKSLSKFIRRASKVLRPRSIITTRDTVASPISDPMIISPALASPPPAAPLASHPPDAPALAEKPRPEPSTATFNTSRASEPLAVEIPRAQPTEPGAHSKQQQEKAQALFAKYGFTLEARDWTPLSKQGAGQATWVENKVRMRIHRECHKCHTSFGSSKTCSNCDHARCKSCPRWPPKKDSIGMTAPTKGLAKVEQELKDATVFGDNAETLIESTPDTRTPTAVATKQEQTMEGVEQEAGHTGETQELGADALETIAIDPVEQTEKLRANEIRRTHQLRGADVVYRPPQHRVRRLCHKCDTMFKGRSTECESCGHQRCPNCPRDPSKFPKFPEGTGYPGDVAEPEPTYPALERVWRKPRIRVRWTCHECDTVFASSNDKACPSCKHTRCDLCMRVPVKKQAKGPSEELLRGLESKLTGLRLLPTSNVEVDTTR